MEHVRPLPSIQGVGVSLHGVQLLGSNGCVGFGTVGLRVGRRVGPWEGDAVILDGDRDGTLEKTSDGIRDGESEWKREGAAEGVSVLSETQ